MSSAANHMKRSHRSNYRSACFNGSRKSVIKPTAGKKGFMQALAILRKYFNRRKEES